MNQNKLNKSKYDEEEERKKVEDEAEEKRKADNRRGTWLAVAVLITVGLLLYLLMFGPVE